MVAEKLTAGSVIDTECQILYLNGTKSLKDIFLPLSILYATRVNESDEAYSQSMLSLEIGFELIDQQHFHRHHNGRYWLASLDRASLTYNRRAESEIGLLQSLEFHHIYGDGQGT